MADRGSSVAKSVSELPGRPVVSGNLVPPTRDVDVARWTQPHSVVIARNDEILAIVMLVLFMLPRIVQSGMKANDMLPEDGGLSTAIVVGAATFVPVLILGGIWVALNKRSAGWLTIDPVRRRVEWRRMKERAGAATAAWSFEEVCAVEAVDPGAHFSGLVAIELPDRTFRVRVPRGLAPAFAESFNLSVHSDSGTAAELEHRP